MASFYLLFIDGPHPNRVDMIFGGSSDELQSKKNDGIDARGIDQTRQIDVPLSGLRRAFDNFGGF